MFILNGIFVSHGLNHRLTINYLISVIGSLALYLFVLNFFDTNANKLKFKVMEQRLRTEKKLYKLGDTEFDNLLFLWYDEENDNFVELDAIYKDLSNDNHFDLTRLPDEDDDGLPEMNLKYLNCFLAFVK